MTRYVDITCWKCNVVYGMPEEYYRVAKQAAGNQTFYCINGHNASFREGPTDAELLRKQLETQRQQNARLEDAARYAREQRDAAERRASAARGQVTKIKKRVGGGVCPCCNRTFENLANHMKSKHAGFATESEA